MVEIDFLSVAEVEFVNWDVKLFKNLTALKLEE